MGRFAIYARMNERSSAGPRPGRPRSPNAVSHAVVMDAVYAMLEDRPLRDLTIDAVAKRAGVGKPTIYKWWPTKAALVLAMFRERLVPELESPQSGSAEQAIRHRVKRLIEQFSGMFGKVMADLIAEGQADADLLRELYERHVNERRAATAAEIRFGIDAGEFRADLDEELLIDVIFGPIYYHLLLRSKPLDNDYGDQLVDLAFRGARGTRPRAA